MATKAQLEEYIAMSFETKDGSSVTTNQLDSLKKADMLDFLSSKGISEADVEVSLKPEATK